MAQKTETRDTLVFGAADFGLHASLTILSKFMAGRRCQGSVFGILPQSPDGMGALPCETCFGKLPNGLVISYLQSDFAVKRTDILGSEASGSVNNFFVYESTVRCKLRVLVWEY